MVKEMTAKLYIGGKITTIDEDDIVLLEQEMTSLQIWKGYVYVNTKDKKEPLHRFLLKKQGVNLDDLVVHHKDGNKLNNAKSNLAGKFAKIALMIFAILILIGVILGFMGHPVALLQYILHDC